MRSGVIGSRRIFFRDQVDEIVPHIVDLGFFIGRALLLEVADALAAAVVLIVQLVHVIGVQYEVDPAPSLGGSFRASGDLFEFLFNV